MNGYLVFYYKDGSAVLYHSGVKNMHWGEWNEETRRRRMREQGLTTKNKKTLSEKFTEAKKNAMAKDTRWGRFLKSTAEQTGYKDIGQTTATKALRIAGGIVAGTTMAAGAAVSAGLIPAGIGTIASIVGLAPLVSGTVASNMELKEGKKRAAADSKLQKKVSESTNLISKGDKLTTAVQALSYGMSMAQIGLTKLALKGAETAAQAFSSSVRPSAAKPTGLLPTNFKPGQTWVTNTPRPTHSEPVLAITSSHSYVNSAGQTVTIPSYTMQPYVEPHYNHFGDGIKFATNKPVSPSGSLEQQLGDALWEKWMKDHPELFRKK